MDMTAARSKVLVRRILMLTVFSIIAVLWFSASVRAENTVEQYKVEPGIVCMVTDKVMGKPQIPVVVDGKTYYGCCRNCVGKLKGNPAVRFAKDPVTGALVDKSKAFILESPTGDALYFESALTAGKFVESISR